MDKITLKVYILLNMLKDIPYFVFLKIIYGSHIAFSAIQEWNGIHIKVKHNGKIKIGKRLKTRKAIYFLVDGGELSIGDICFMNHNVSITCLNKIEIGNNVKIANNVVIVDHNHDYLNGGIKRGNIMIGDNVWIGANAVILPNVSIGANAVIAAGSVVNKNVVSNSVVGGIPCREIKKFHI